MMRINPRGRRGAALVLVIVLMALVTVMVYAMLEGSVVQEESATGLAGAAQADALSESGIELAMYYLQHPQNAPTLVPSAGVIPSYWPGGTNITFGGMTGSCTVSVSPQGSTGLLWTLVSTGTYPSGIGNLSKTHSATAQVNATYQFPQAITSNSGLTLSANTTISGTPTAIVSNGAVSINSSGHVTGSISATSVTGPFSGGSLEPAPVSLTVPGYTLVNGLLTYVLNGVSGTAQNLVLGILNLILGSNPGGVLKYTGGNVTVTSLSSPISGTLYVTKGNLTISGPVTINPVAGMPAIVCSGNLNMSALSSLTANGVVYLGTGINTGPATSAISINGALLLAANGISSNYLGTLHVTYNAALANLPNLSSSAAYLTPLSVKLISWTP
jgi:Tfp pilus assembly protein PilX